MDTPSTDGKMRLPDRTRTHNARIRTQARQWQADVKAVADENRRCAQQPLHRDLRPGQHISGLSDPRPSPARVHLPARWHDPPTLLAPSRQPRQTAMKTASDTAKRCKAVDNRQYRADVHSVSTRGAASRYPAQRNPQRAETEPDGVPLHPQIAPISPLQSLGRACRRKQDKRCLQHPRTCHASNAAAIR